MFLHSSILILLIVFSLPTPFNIPYVGDKIFKITLDRLVESVRITAPQSEYTKNSFKSVKVGNAKSLPYSLYE